MSKTRAIIYTIIGVSLLYIPLSIYIKFLADTTVSVNADLAAAHNMSLYPGTSGFLLSTPWIMYVVPAAIGIIVIITILKRKPVA